MATAYEKVMEYIKEKKYEKVESIGGVDYYMVEKTPYSFHFYARYSKKSSSSMGIVNGVSTVKESIRQVVEELKYDLRNREFFIRRNGKEVVFNVNNLNNIIPRVRETCDTEFDSQEGVDVFLDMVSVEENKGMYGSLVNTVGALDNERVKMTSRALIRLILDFNKLELIYKMGINIRSIVSDSKLRTQVVTAGIENKSKVHEILGVSKAHLKFMRDLKVDFSSNTIHRIGFLDKEDMDVYRGYIEVIEKLEEKYNVFNKVAEFKRNSSPVSFINHVYYGKESQHRHTPSRYSRSFIGFILAFDIKDIPRLIEYLLFQCDVSQGLSFESAISELRDYYRMCIDMGYEKFDKYPKYLKTMHDVVARNFNLIRDELQNQKFAKAVETYKELETNIGAYSIVVPTECRDVVEEGNELNHCVASYVTGVAEGDTQIMFLREREDKEKSLVTVEVRKGRIVQARGKSNRGLVAEEKQALTKFAKKKELEVAI